MKKLLKITGIVLLSFIAFVGLYLLAAYGLSRITVAREKAGRDEVVIYILTNNGIHTDIVLPVRNDQIDWSREIRYTNTGSKDSSGNYLAFGWGDKGFYLETPTWGDLKFSTAFKAAFNLSTSAFHTTFLKNMKESDRCKRIAISKEQYARLIAYIQKDFKTDASGHVLFINTKAVYGTNDAFYEATGSYNLFHTCNTWANNALKSCGQKACLWTPFEGGIFYQYNK